MNFEQWFYRQRDDFNRESVKFLSLYSLLEQAEKNSLNYTVIENDK